jgi:hypothetical protein
MRFCNGLGLKQNLGSTGGCCSLFLAPHNQDIAIHRKGWGQIRYGESILKIVLV